MDRAWHRREGFCFLGSTENSQSSLSDSSNTYRQLWSVAKGWAGQGMTGQRGGRKTWDLANLHVVYVLCRSASLFLPPSDPPDTQHKTRHFRKKIGNPVNCACPSYTLYHVAYY